MSSASDETRSIDVGWEEVVGVPRLGIMSVGGFEVEGVCVWYGKDIDGGDDDGRDELGVVDASWLDSSLCSSDEV